MSLLTLYQLNLGVSAPSHAYTGSVALTVAVSGGYYTNRAYAGNVAMTVAVHGSYFAAPVQVQCIPFRSSAVTILDSRPSVKPSDCANE